eukprot:154373-Chlamydomonas_euryale.AAC.1
MALGSGCLTLHSRAARFDARTRCYAAQTCRLRVCARTLQRWKNAVCVRRVYTAEPHDTRRRTRAGGRPRRS